MLGRAEIVVLLVLAALGIGVAVVVVIIVLLLVRRNESKEAAVRHEIERRLEQGREDDL